MILIQHVLHILFFLAFLLIFISSSSSTSESSWRWPGDRSKRDLVYYESCLGSNSIRHYLENRTVSRKKIIQIFGFSCQPTDQNWELNITQWLLSCAEIDLIHWRFDQTSFLSRNSETFAKQVFLSCPDCQGNTNNYKTKFTTTCCRHCQLKTCW